MTAGYSNVPGPSIADNFSLVSGGPFYRALQRIGLFKPHHNIKRIAAWLILTWLPLLILSLVAGTAWGNKVKIPLLDDFSIYGRFFLAIPLLIAAEAVIDPFILRTVSTFNTSGIIEEGELPVYHATLEKIARLRDSALIELLLLLLAWIPFFLLFAEYQWVSPQVSAWHGTTAQGLSAAGWWFAFVSSPLLRFLMFRWLWRYALWSYLLRSVTRLNLNLLPTHPDRRGGLGFLLSAQQQFGIVATALGSVIAGQLANEVVHFGATLDAVRATAATFVVLAVSIILLPLTLFSLQLFEARRDGLIRYGVVARGVTTTFDAKWASRMTDPPPGSMIGSPDPSSLIDYISSYDVIRETQVFLTSRRAVIYIAILAAAPFVPVWLLATPLDKLIGEILKRLL
jgi:hypothetical protein